MEEIQIEVSPQSPYEAFSFLWNILVKMPFYVKNGYHVSLPKNNEISILAQDPLKLQNIDQQKLGNKFINEIYNPSDFSSGLRKITQQLNEIKKLTPHFQELHKFWGFKIFPKYLVKLTLYGPGGNYNTETGTILIKTNKKGDFKIPPLQNIIHELIHLGIEDNIVNRFRLSHSEKEALVDQICSVVFDHLFKKILTIHLEPS